MKFKNWKEFGNFMKECEEIWSQMASKNHSSWELYEFEEDGISFYEELYDRCGDHYETIHFNITWNEIFNEMKSRSNYENILNDIFDGDEEFYSLIKPLEKI